MTPFLSMCRDAVKAFFWILIVVGGFGLLVGYMDVIGFRMLRRGSPMKTRTKLLSMLLYCFGIDWCYSCGGWRWGNGHKCAGGF